jgi:hypothetical protein
MINFVANQWENKLKIVGRSRAHRERKVHGDAHQGNGTQWLYLCSFWFAGVSRGRTVLFGLLGVEVRGAAGVVADVDLGSLVLPPKDQCW